MSNTIELERLAIGVVGLGRIGRQHALNALHYVTKTRLLCACSPIDADITWADENLVPYGVSVFRTFEEMLNQPGLSAVLIASTTKVHHPQVLLGIQKGLHILVEKPLAMNLAQSQEILSLAKQPENTHLKIMTAFSRRFDASYTTARQAIKEGKIGSPILIRCENRDKYDRSEFYMRYIMANPGIFIDTAVHDIDLTLSFLGPFARPKSCYAVGTIAAHKELASIHDVDNAVGTVEWYPPIPRYNNDNDAVAPISTYTLSRTAPHGFDNPTEIFLPSMHLKINMHPRRDLIETADGNGISNTVSPDFYERYEKAFVTELSVFAEAVLEGKELPYELNVAVKGMEIAEALQESLRLGRKIEWDESGNRKERISL